MTELPHLVLAVETWPDSVVGVPMVSSVVVCLCGEESEEGGRDPVEAAGRARTAHVSHRYREEDRRRRALASGVS